MNTLPGSIRHDRLKHGCNWLRQHVPLGSKCEAWHLGVILCNWKLWDWTNYQLERLILGVCQVTPADPISWMFHCTIEYIYIYTVFDGFLNPKVDNCSVQDMPTYLLFRQFLEVGGLGLRAQQPPLVAADGWNAQVEGLQSHLPHLPSKGTDPRYRWHVMP